CAKKEDSFDIW
nr:immunoglobulin heavy chain junction region [Macaca mulatta]MOV91414.1 immunoglobulin heavy chain junction region [Macaca mulatta]